MNLIDAWKSAKEGQKVSCEVNGGVNRYEFVKSVDIPLLVVIRDVIYSARNVSETVVTKFLQSDGWKIEKTRRTAAGKVLGVIDQTTTLPSPFKYVVRIHTEIPPETEVEISWEE